METFITYLIRSSLIITIIYMAYQMLRNDHNFTRNRIYLLSGLLLALMLPLFSFIPSASVPLSGSIVLQPVIISSGKIGPVVGNHPDIFRIILFVWLSGLLLLLAKNAWQIMKLYRLARHSEITYMKGYKLLRTASEVSPFSFFRWIFMPQHLGEKETATILAHERAHADQYHSVDVLLMELICMLQWFNPAVWYYRHQLREVHEYLADRSLIHKGIEKAGYLELLFAMALKVQPADITNSFCQIKLKRRLKMITKSQSSRLSGAKFIILLPVLGLFIWMVSCNQSAKDVDSDGADTSTVKKEVAPADNNSGTQTPTVNDKSENAVFTVVEEMPEYPGGTEAMNKFIAGNINYPQKAKENGVQGTVYVSFHIAEDGSVSNALIMRGIGSGCDEEALRVVKMMPKWKPGKQKGKTVKVSFTLPVKFRLH